MSDLSKIKPDVILQRVSTDECKDSYKALFQVGNFSAQYSNHITTETLNMNQIDRNNIQIQQCVQHNSTKLKKSTKLLVGNQIIVIHDMFEYIGSGNQKINSVVQCKSVSSTQSDTSNTDTISDKCNQIKIEKKLIELFVKQLRKNQRATQKKILSSKRKELNYLISRKQVDFQQLKSLLTCPNFCRILLKFLKNLDQQQKSNLQTTFSAEEINKAIQNLISKIQLRCLEYTK